MKMPSLDSKKMFAFIKTLSKGEVRNLADAEYTYWADTEIARHTLLNPYSYRRKWELNRQDSARRLVKKLCAYNTMAKKLDENEAFISGKVDITDEEMVHDLLRKFVSFVRDGGFEEIPELSSKAMWERSKRKQA